MFNTDHALTITGKPLNELQVRVKEYLMKIAPEGEVMLALSNYNLLCCSK